MIACFQAFNAMLWYILVNNCNLTFLICSCSVQPEHTQVSIYFARMLVTRKCNFIHLSRCPHLSVNYPVLYSHSRITQRLETPLGPGRLVSYLFLYFLKYQVAHTKELISHVKHVKCVMFKTFLLHGDLLTFSSASL